MALRMGIVLTHVSAETTVATMPVQGNTQPFGLLNGGASLALAETIGSIAANVHAGPGRYAVGLDINGTHHKAATSGLVTATATALALGKTIASYEILVRNDADDLLCTARLTCLIRDSHKA